MAQALVETDVIGTVTWLGCVTDRAAGLASDPVASVALRFAGIDGEAHSGLTRASCGRVTGLYPRGTDIRNTRQVTILSEAEIAATRRRWVCPHWTPLGSVRPSFWRVSPT